MDCDRIIDEFVARVNSSIRERLCLEEVPAELRVPSVSSFMEDPLDLTDWRIIAADHSSRIESLERRLGLRFPASFRSLIGRYSFPAFECGQILFFSNTGIPMQWELQDKLFSDPVMSPQLLAAGYLQIGNPRFYHYDPVCIEASPTGREGRVVQLSHEAILCSDEIVVLKDLAPTFLQLIVAMLMEEVEPGAESDLR